MTKERKERIEKACAMRAQKMAELFGRFLESAVKGGTIIDGHKADSGVYGRWAELWTAGQNSTKNGVSPKKKPDVKIVINGVPVSVEVKCGGGNLRDFVNGNARYIVYSTMPGALKPSMKGAAWGGRDIAPILCPKEWFLTHMPINYDKKMVAGDTSDAAQPSSKKFYLAMLDAIDSGEIKLFTPDTSYTF